MCKSVVTFRCVIVARLNVLSDISNPQGIGCTRRPTAQWALITPLGRTKITWMSSNEGRRRLPGIDWSGVYFRVEMNGEQIIRKAGRFRRAVREANHRDEKSVTKLINNDTYSNSSFFKI